MGGMRLISITAAMIVTLLQASGTPGPEDNVFFGNLHSHTSFSDGSGTPAQAYKRARDVAKLDFLAITEHNHSKAEDGIDDDDPRKDGLSSPITPRCTTTRRRHRSFRRRKYSLWTARLWFSARKQGA